MGNAPRVYENDLPRGTGFISPEKKWNKDTLDTYRIVIDEWEKDPSQNYFKVSKEDR